MDDELEQDVLDKIDAHRPETFPGGSYPSPTVDEPGDDDIVAMLTDQIETEATDGCHVDPDGVCPHGHPSWLVVLKLV
ncbi:MAG: hypothetical protein OEU92_19810 [Alphaproteobacteria bacterium]|nr:hypothetical protein [Alphaproteobacteria bacterium]